MAKKIDYDALLRETGSLGSVEPDYTLGLSRAEWQVVWGMKSARTGQVLRAKTDSGEWVSDRDWRVRGDSGYHRTPVYKPAKDWTGGLMQAAVRKLQEDKP